MGDNDKKPTAEGSKEPQLLFKAELIILPDGKKDIGFTFKTDILPTLDTISKELDYHIIELRAMKKAKQEQAKIKLLTKGPIMSLNQFLNRKKR